jgi:hypothetical protein
MKLNPQILFCNMTSSCVFRNKHDIRSWVFAYQGLLLLLFTPNTLFVQCWNFAFRFNVIKPLISLNNLFENLQYKYFKYILRNILA